jgi:hypothetical protein
MSQEFSIENREPGWLVIVHLGEGHRFTFHVASHDDGRRILSPDYKLASNDRAKHGGKHFVSKAFSFAEKYFENTGQIDTV